MEMLNLIKKAAIEAVEQGSPADTIIGTVKSTDPLVITISQRLDIPKEFILLTDNVRDYSVDIEYTHTTDNASPGGYTHNHSINGPTTITIKNGLEAGEKVVLTKAKGGQRYIILNRAVEA